MNHPLAPDEIILEPDPWGDMCAYAKFGTWTVSTVEFSNRGVYNLDNTDEQAAALYRIIWLTTGIEPDQKKCYHHDIYPPLLTTRDDNGTQYTCSVCRTPLQNGCKHYTTSPHTSPETYFSRRPEFRRGDRDLAERLLYEHGLDPDYRSDLDAETVEILAATGHLTHYEERPCSICKATWQQNCDAGLHG